MKRDVKSKGREKNITSSKGSVKKRGSGLNTGKPVGSGRRPSSSSSTSSSGTGSSSNSNKAQSQGLSLKKIIIIGVIILIGYFLLKSCMDTPLDTGTIFDVNSQSTVSIESDADSDVLNTTVSDEARDKYTLIAGVGEDVFTIMIYMCGSDLESRAGMATADLNEILHADIGENVNIIVETGGTKTWKNNIISNRTNQRYLCTSDGLKLIADDLGKKQMTSPDTLTDFITYCKDNYSANRYALILWDHGGGSNQGYGYDEFKPNATMTLDEIDLALNKANCKFDFVGFDACLMATYETAIMLDDYADYLIASEETEPGIGWYYTDWISALSKNTSMSTLTIGQNIIDDFVDKCYQASPRDKTTLSIIDLAELSGTVPVAFNAFASSTDQLINSDEYKIVSDARSGSREFGSPNRLDQIDLIHLLENMNTDESNKLIDALSQCIKYNRSSSTISNANGLSIYFPFTTLSAVGPMISTYEKIGMDKAYTDCIRGFANLEVGGQAVSFGSSSPFSSLMGSFLGGDTSGTIGSLLIPFLIGQGDFGSMLGGGDDTDTSWIDIEQMSESASYYEENSLGASAMELTEKNGGYVLDMSDEEWDLVQTINLNVFLDDGQGYIDLGLDNVYEFNDDGDLALSYDGTWLAINSQVVSYYFLSEEYDGNDYTIVGRVPAMLNDEQVDLILVFTQDYPYGEVVGARKVYLDSPNTVAKGLIDIKVGDEIDYLCDYYSYDEEYTNSYYLGDRMKVTGRLDISNVSVGDADSLVTYQLTDIYNNTYWTPALQYK